MVNPAYHTEADREWIGKALSSRNSVGVVYNQNLICNGKHLGLKGWNALSAFWEGDKPLGWLATFAAKMSLKPQTINSLKPLMTELKNFNKPFLL